ncbi:hypothetical protein ACGC1H_003137 [Rhizoctonia solani]
MESTRVRPINSFPTEILTRVFVLACAMRPCSVSLSDFRDGPTFTNKPVIISHVCSYWRHIAITSTLLWTHIDLDLSQFEDGHLPPRVETYLERAGGQLLDIHIIYPLSLIGASSLAQDSFFQLLELISPRAWRMTMEMTDVVPNIDLCQRTISTVLNNCVPGTLAHLSIQIYNTFHSPEDPIPIPEELETRVEALGLPITVLQLRDFFPLWTSHVYHGLTELRLKSSRVSVPQLALMAILKMSPKLRILEIDILIREVTQIHDPVMLEDLEVLIAENYCVPRQTHVLSMIQPGSKPLTLTLGVYSLRIILQSTSSSHSDEVINHFFSRSNITRLIVHALKNYADVANLLALIPTVQTLALHKPILTRVVPNESTLPPAFALDTLYLTDPVNPRVTLPTLERVVQRHSVRKFIVWGESEVDAILDKLSTMCPHVMVISHQEANPIKEWI